MLNRTLTLTLALTLILTLPWPYACTFRKKESSVKWTVPDVHDAAALVNRWCVGLYNATPAGWTRPDWGRRAARAAVPRGNAEDAQRNWPTENHVRLVLSVAHWTSYSCWVKWLNSDMYFWLPLFKRWWNTLY